MMAGTSTDRSGPRPGLRRRPPLDPAWVEAERRRAEQRRRRDRSLIRHGVALVLVVAALAAVHAVREVPDPRHAEGERLAAEMDAAFAAVVDGRLELDDDPAGVGPGVAGAEVTVGDRTIRVLTGEAGGECYAHWWDDELVRHSRVLADGIPCRPATIVTSIRPVHFVRLGPVVEHPAPYDWERVLRDPVRERTWYLPAMVVGGGAALSIVTRMTTTLISGKPPGQLSREERRRKR